MPAISPPPALPVISDPSGKLSEYLRRFALWATGNFNNCLTKREATGEFYMKSSTGSTVWRITIDDSGALHTAQLTPGQGP